MLGESKWTFYYKPVLEDEWKGEIRNKAVEG
jgi:hypothetical protein